jgi:restriction endonuclease S subunit
VKQDVVFHNFREIIEAPNGIKRFNVLVLELAVTGNLRLKSNQIIDLETGFPNNWSIKSFSEIASFTIGKTPPTKDSSYWTNSDSIMWVSIADMRNGETIDQSNKYVTNLAKEDVFRREPWPVGTLLMSFKLTIGKMARLGRPAFFNEAIFSFDTGNEITNEYLFRVLPVLSQKADLKGAIKGNTLNSDSIRKMLIPIPPIDEQEMLIKIIDEISDKCQVLEQELNASGKLQNSAQKSAIDAILTAQTSEELHIAWERIQDNWKVFVDSHESIDFMKKLILNLGLAGQLLDKLESFDLSEMVALRSEEKPILLTDMDKVRNSRGDEFFTASISSITEVIPQSLSKIKSSAIQETGQYPVVDQGKTFVSGYVDGVKPVKAHGSPVIIFGDHTRNIKYVDFDFVVGADGVKILRPYFLNPRYLFYMAQGIDIKSRGYGRHFREFCNSRIPVISIEDQDKTVRIIEAIFTICEKLEKEISQREMLAEKFARSVVSESA